MVTRFDIGDIGTDGFHHAGGFMSKYGGKKIRVGSVLEVQVGVANSSGNRAYQHFSGERLAYGDIFNFQWLGYFMKYGSFHNWFPLCCNRILM